MAQTEGLPRGCQVAERRKILLRSGILLNYGSGLYFIPTHGIQENRFAWSIATGSTRTAPRRVASSGLPDTTRAWFRVWGAGRRYRSRAVKTIICRCFQLTYSYLRPPVWAPARVRVRRGWCLRWPGPVPRQRPGHPNLWLSPKVL